MTREMTLLTVAKLCVWNSSYWYKYILVNTETLDTSEEISVASEELYSMTSGLMIETSIWSNAANVMQWQPANVAGKQPAAMLSEAMKKLVTDWSWKCNLEMTIWREKQLWREIWLPTSPP